MIRSSQTVLLEEGEERHPIPGAFWPSWLEDDVQRDLKFLLDFNGDLERNAQLSRLDEKYLEEKLEELEGHTPILREACGQTRARLHELLLLCAANYANNCEYAAVGDLMFNPRLLLVHIRGRHEPVVKERHTPLSEQFMDKAPTRVGVIEWLKKETTLEIIKRPLIPHNFDMLEASGSVSRDYLDSARSRAVRIADLSASLCCLGFQDRLSLERWLKGASENDRNMMNASLIPLDWEKFRELGEQVHFLAWGQEAPRA